MSHTPDDPQAPKEVPALQESATTARPHEAPAASSLAPSRSGWSTANLLIVSVTVVALAGIGLALYYLVPNPLRDCPKLAPQDSSLTVQVPGTGASGPSVGAAVAVRSTTSGVQSEVQRRSIKDCWEAAAGTKADDPNQAAGGPTTLGEVMALWDSTPQGLRIQLPSNQPVLQNFDFGKYRGQKPEVMAMWCKANAACVRCTPDPATQTNGVVAVSLTGAASAPVRTPMDFNKGSWNAQNPPRPYEDVASGVRFSYLCPEVRVSP